MKKELREIIEVKELKILSERKNKAGDTTMRIIAPWIVTGRKNQNGRLYSLPLIQREVAKFQDRVNQGSAIGSADHPSGAFTTLDDASHIITKLEVDKQGRGTMEATILPTSKGKNVIEIIKAGGQLGISARGAGTVSPSGTVESDYKLLGIDLCTSPSEPEAVFNKDNVFESVDFESEDDESIADKEKAMYELLQASYGRALDGGFHADFDFYCELHENGLRKVMHLPTKDFNSEKKLTEEAVSARVLSFYQESVQGGFKGDLAKWKEKFPQIVEMASEPVEKIVEKKEPEKPFKAKISWSEAQASGFTGTIAEYRKAYPDIELILPAPRQKRIDENETFEERCQRVFETLKRDNPDSNTTLEDVKRVFVDDEAPKKERKIRELAIARVNKSIQGSGSAPSQEMWKKWVEEEIVAIKEAREERKRKNWQAYKRLLD